MSPAPGTVCWGGVVARPVAAIGDSGRLILRDGADLYHLAAPLPDGGLVILVGPISVDAALDAADLMLRGGQDHHSVTGLILMLSLSLRVVASLGGEPCTTS